MPASPSSAPALNAWDSKRLLLKPRPDGRHISPTSTLERRQAAAAAAESCVSSDTDDAEDEGGQEGPPLPSPPPPPPPRSPHAAAPHLGPATPIAMLPPAVEAQQQPLFSAAAELQSMPAQPPQQHLAAMWAGDQLLPNSNHWVRDALRAKRHWTRRRVLAPCHRWRFNQVLPLPLCVPACSL